MNAESILRRWFADNWPAVPTSTVRRIANALQWPPCTPAELQAALDLWSSENDRPPTAADIGHCLKRPRLDAEAARLSELEADEKRRADEAHAKAVTVIRDRLAEIDANPPEWRRPNHQTPPQEHQTA